MNSLGFLMMLVGAYYFLQGMGGNPGLHDQILSKFLQENLKLDEFQAETFSFYLVIPWMIKPLYGLISDFFPIFRLRRKSYFILTSLLGIASYLGLVFWGVSYQNALVLLCVAGVSFAFSDVLCDAVMVEKGQPLQATDRLQAAQWTANGVAGIIIALVGGYIAEYLTLQQALLLSAVAPALVILLTLFFLKEEPAQSSAEAAKLAWGGLKAAMKSPVLWTTAIFLFLFQCNPHLGGNVFYQYQKKVLGFSEILIGHIRTVGAVGFVLGAVFYGYLSKRLSHRGLLHAIISTGVVTTLMYLWFKDARSAFIITGVTSVVSVVSFLGLLTVAAKACPKHAEGVMFALLMSFLNFGQRFGGIIGAKLYQSIGYSNLILLSAALTAAMWLLMPFVKEKKEDSSTSSP
jgi:predicted MFS family arabinose efflux permease